ncbi:hypothetical protein V7968_31775 [Nocardia vulneris]|uniref:hypothetical protein n=1 Tax=Nocardia vulneris TaxID=1141657 RepID=UPI0030CE6218
MTTSVTAEAAMRWLHDEGLARLAGTGGGTAEALCAFTIEVATGTVIGYPVVGAGPGADVLTLAADALPAPQPSVGRLVIVGRTFAESILVVDLATVPSIAIDGAVPEATARAWVLQLLLNPQVTITTNSGAIGGAGLPRCSHTFIPGGGATIVNVDDKRLPVTAIRLSPAENGPDYADIAADGTGELYLGPRCWRLQQTLLVDDEKWRSLAATLEQEQTA